MLTRPPVRPRPPMFAIAGPLAIAPGASGCFQPSIVEESHGTLVVWAVGLDGEPHGGVYVTQVLEDSDMRLWVQGHASGLPAGDAALLGTFDLRPGHCIDVRVANRSREPLQVDVGFVPLGTEEEEIRAGYRRTLERATRAITAGLAIVELLERDARDRQTS